MHLGRENAAYLTDKKLNYHTQIIGGSGAGKTNLLVVMLEDRMAKGHSIIFFDFKADNELMDCMAGASEQNARKDDLVILSISDPKLSYNLMELYWLSLKHFDIKETREDEISTLEACTNFYVHKIGSDVEFEFREVMEAGKIAYLFINSLKLKDTASIMGKLFINIFITSKTKPSINIELKHILVVY